MGIQNHPMGIWDPKGIRIWDPGKICGIVWEYGIKASRENLNGDTSLEQWCRNHVCTCIHTYTYAVWKTVCCSVLQCVQCVTVCCAMLWGVGSVVQCVAVCCCVLQCVAVCCSVCCAILWGVGSVVQCVAVCCSVLQCVAVCVALCCGVLVVCCSVLQCVAVCCSVLHCTTVIHAYIHTHIHTYTRTMHTRARAHTQKHTHTKAHTPTHTRVPVPFENEYKNRSLEQRMNESRHTQEQVMSHRRKGHESHITHATDKIEGWL